MNDVSLRLVIGGCLKGMATIFVSKKKKKMERTFQPLPSFLYPLSHMRTFLLFFPSYHIPLLVRCSPLISPSLHPSLQPSLLPSLKPSLHPSLQPSLQLSLHPVALQVLHWQLIISFFFSFFFFPGRKYNVLK